MTCSRANFTFFRIRYVALVRDLFSPPDVSEGKSNELRTSRIYSIRNWYKNCNAKMQRRSLVRLRGIWEDNIKMELKYE